MSVFTFQPRGSEVPDGRPGAAAGDVLSVKLLYRH